MNDLNGNGVFFKFWEFVDDDVPDVIVFFIGVECEKDLVGFDDVFA